MGALVPPDDLPEPSRLVPIDDLPAPALMASHGPGSPVGAGEAALRALSSVGTAGFGTKMFGLRPASRMSGFSEHGALGPDEEKRRRLMDEQIARDAQALKEHPVVSLLAGAPAAALATPIVAARAPDLLGRVVQASQIGAGFGAASGLGRARTLGEVPGNVGGDAIVGALAGPAVQTVGEGLGAGYRAVQGRLVPWLEEKAINQGRRVLTGNAAPMANRNPLSEEAIQAAYDVKAIRPFGTVEKAAERLGAAREAVGGEYAQIIDALEAKGVTGPNAVLLAREISDEGKKIAGRSLGSPAPGMYQSIADEIATKVDPTPFASKRIPLSNAEGMKRTLQRGARSDYVKEGPESLAGEARIGLASKLRQSVEDAIAEQASKAPEEAAAFVPVKQRLGPIIEASTAADRASARAANRQQFGLGSKVLAGGALASGNVPGAMATMLGATALRNQGPATVGWTANSLARALGRQAPNMTPRAAGASSGALSEEILALLQAMQGPRVGLPVGAAEESPR